MTTGARGAVVQALRRHGYEVLEASNAGEAILVSEQHAGTIDVVLTDVDVAERIRARRPETLVVLTVGDTDGDVVATVREVLDSRRAAAMKSGEDPR